MPTPRGSLHGKHVAGHPQLQYQGLGNFIRVRVKVPGEVQDRFGGKRELTKGLGTACLKEAIARSHGPIAEFQARIDRALAEIGKQPRNVLVYNPLGSFDLAMLHRAVMASQQFGGIDALRIGNASAEPVPASELPLAGYSWQQGLDDYALEKRIGDSTKDVYAGHLGYFFEEQKIASGLMGDVRDTHIISHKQGLLRDGVDGKPVKAKTVNNRLGSIRAVFRLAKGNKKIAVDPTLDDGEPVIHKLKVDKNRKGFTREQYPEIVAAALQSDNPVIKWLWVLGATWGARIGEIADAKVSAVQEIGGRIVFDISPDHRMSWMGEPLGLKTEGSVRILPLHSAALRAGFLAYVESVRAERGSDAPLFPMLRPNRYGKRSDEASMICNAWLRDVMQIEDSRLVFHSLRHSIKTFLRGRVGDETHKALTGHAGGSVSAGYGETEIAAMSAAIEENIKLTA